MRDGAGCAARTLAIFFSSMTDNEIADPLQRTEFAAHQANAAVFELYRGSGGATLSAICVALTGKAALVNVGDSRIYGGKVKDVPPINRLTVDDSLEEAVGGHGRELLQFIGMGDGLKVHRSMISPDTQRLLITSDGVHYINHDALCDIFWKAPDIYRAAERLTAMARWCGSPDNASLAVVDLKRLREDFDISAEASLSIWDPFGSVEFHASSSVPQPNQSKPRTVPDPRSAHTTEGREIVKTDSSLDIKKSKKRRPRKEVSQDTNSVEAPQLVIQIDGDTNSTASEKSGEASK